MTSARRLGTIASTEMPPAVDPGPLS